MSEKAPLDPQTVSKRMTPNLGSEKPGSKVGRGSGDKVPIITAVQTNDKHNPLYVTFSKIKTFSNAAVIYNERWLRLAEGQC